MNLDIIKQFSENLSLQELLHKQFEAALNRYNEVLPFQAKFILDENVLPDDLITSGDVCKLMGGILAGKLPTGFIIIKRMPNKKIELITISYGDGTVADDRAIVGGKVNSALVKTKFIKKGVWSVNNFGISLTDKQTVNKKDKKLIDLVKKEITDSVYVDLSKITEPSFQYITFGGNIIEEKIKIEEEANKYSRYTLPNH